MTKLNGQLDRLTILIRDLLDTTKIAEGKLELRWEKFNIAELIDERVEELQRISEKHKITFKAEKLKPVLADKERIGQVLTNLVSNALKYSPAGENIRIAATAQPKGIKVTVTDKGIGIDDELKERIFDRFYRIKGTKGQSSGMGLGLYISAAIIHRHKGTIGVNSKPGKGSTFYFTIPYKQSKKG